jgi:hypothetical protein
MGAGSHHRVQGEKEGFIVEWGETIFTFYRHPLIVIGLSREKQVGE